MRNILRNPIFITIVSIAVVGSACGLLAGLGSKDIDYALAVAATSMAACLLPGISAFLIISALSHVPALTDGTAANVQSAEQPATFAVQVQQELQGPSRYTPEPETRLQDDAEHPQATDHSCPRCGRNIDQGILACPDLSSGHCAFRNVNLVSTESRLRAIVPLLSGLVFAWAAYRFIQDSRTAPGLWFASILYGSISALFISFGLFGAVRTHIALQDPASGLAWTRVSLLGLPLTHVLIARGEPLPAPPAPPVPASFPCSVVALSGPGSNAAAEILRAALLGLWARSYIRIWRYHRYVAHGWARYELAEDAYTFSLDPESNWASADGDLEREMLLVLSHWTTEKDQPGIWPFSPSAYDLVRSLGERERGSLQRWIVACATRDATTHGWGQFQGRLHKRYEPSPHYSALLYREQISLNALSSWLAREQPHFSEVLDEEIARTVRSPRDAPQEYDYAS